MPRGGEGIAINKEMVTLARERAGLTVEEPAQQFRHIAAWEAGDTQPTYPQFESVADEFKLPIAACFFPQPPRTPPICEFFRTLPDTEFARIPKAIRFLLQKAKALQLNLAEMTQGVNPTPRQIARDLKLRDDVTPERKAVRVHDYLGVSLAVQFAWRDDDTALQALRTALLDVGIFVFKDAFGTESFFEFSPHHPSVPLARC